MYKRFEFFILRKIGVIRFKKLGEKSIIKYGLFGDPGNISIEKYVYIGENANLWGLGGITIGAGTIIGPNVTIRSSNHNYKSPDMIPYGTENELRKVEIGDNCWIGDAVCITPGTIIGEGSVIGMGSVISGKIPNFSVVVGNPGKVIKTRNKETYMKAKEKGYIYMKYK